MYTKKKERLYISELLEEPIVTYPAYYVLSSALIQNEMLQHALMVLHSMDFEHYEHPKRYDDIFTMFENGIYPIYKELYVVGFFGGKMMYLESAGWKAMACTQDVFKMENWFVC